MDKNTENSEKTFDLAGTLFKDKERKEIKRKKTDAQKPKTTENLKKADDNRGNMVEVKPDDAQSVVSPRKELKQASEHDQITMLTQAYLKLERDFHKLTRTQTSEAQTPMSGIQTSNDTHRSQTAADEDKAQTQTYKRQEFVQDGEVPSTSSSKSSRKRARSDSDLEITLNEPEDDFDVEEEIIDQILSGDKNTQKKQKPVQDDWDPDLQAMQEDMDKEEAVGPPTTAQLAGFMNKLIEKSAKEEKIDKLYESYLKPENIEGFYHTKVNPELWRNLPIPARARDIKLQRIQRRISTATTAVLKGVEGILKIKATCPALNGPAKDLFNALILLESSNNEVNFRRKDFLKPNINGKFHELIKTPTKGNKLLFGDDLPKYVRELTENNKVGDITYRNYNNYNNFNQGQAKGKNQDFQRGFKKGPKFKNSQHGGYMNNNQNRFNQKSQYKGQSYQYKKN